MTYCLSLEHMTMRQGIKVLTQRGCFKCFPWWKKLDKSFTIMWNSLQPTEGSTLTACVLQAQFEHFQMEWDCLEQPSMWKDWGGLAPHAKVKEFPRGGEESSWKADWCRNCRAAKCGWQHCHCRGRTKKKAQEGDLRSFPGVRWISHWIQNTRTEGKRWRWKAALAKREEQC